MGGSGESSGDRGISNRAAEIAVALAIIAAGAIVIFDSRRLGAGWDENGPQAGYFPFYLGLIICAAGTLSLIEALVGGRTARGMFASWDQFKRVLAVLLPLVAYLVVLHFLGIYLSAVLFIALFMVFVGRYPWWKAALVAIGINVVFFALFEIWFLVPLYKGEWNPMSFLGF